MPTQVIMPQLGESITEGTISRWLKQPGDSIREYEPLLEVSTDKVDTEIPSPASGTLLSIHIQPGQTVPFGTLLAVIGEPESAPSPEAPAPPGLPAAEASTGRLTPVVARMVAEHRLDLSELTGTGRGGRVTRKDIEAYLATYSALLSSSAVEGSPPAIAPAPSLPTQPAPEKRSDRAGTLIPLTPMRRAIAGHMVRSQLQTAPHVTTIVEADLSAVFRHRETERESPARQGIHLTLTAYFARAAVTALTAHPYLNACWTEEGILLNPTVNLGIAVALEDGLIVPVIHDAQELSLIGLARAINELSDRARARQLKPDEVAGGTFSLTNHGIGGSLFATPIINQPQVAILGTGVVEKRVKVIGDAIAIRPCIYLSLTFDHRVVDGAVADAYMAEVKRHLETWA